MKNILIGLFLLNSLCFAHWTVMEKKDEFGDNTGIIESIAGGTSSNSRDFLTIDREGKLQIILYKPKFITEKEIKIKFKIDNNSPYTLIAKNLDPSFELLGMYEINDEGIIKKIIEDFKKGTIAKIIIVDDNNDNYLITIPLKNFSNSYNRLINSK